MALDALWLESFPDRVRPKLYTSNILNEDGYLPLSEPAEFLSNDIASLNPSQLYVLTANNAKALENAQQEYVALEKLVNQIKAKEPNGTTAKDPQALTEHLLFDERKEATLYNYKYDLNRKICPPRFTASDLVTDQEKFDCRELPDPFTQGGYVPNNKQYKTIMNKARDKQNPDDWVPVLRNGKHLIPKMQMREEDRLRADKTIYQAPPAAVLANGRPVAGLLHHGNFNDSDFALASKLPPQRAATRRTRYNGEKVPVTRDLSPASGPGLGSEFGTPKLPRSMTPMDVDAYTPNNRKRKVLEVAPTAEPPRKKRHNQYTKAREREEIARREAESRAATEDRFLPPPSREVSTPPRSIGNDNYPTFKTDKELIDAVNVDYKWLHPDPIRAASWRDKISQAQFPIRTHAMLRKWGEWKNTNRDKRPRKQMFGADGSRNEESAEELPSHQLPNATKGPNGLVRETESPMSVSSGFNNSTTAIRRRSRGLRDSYAWEASQDLDSSQNSQRLMHKSLQDIGGSQAEGLSTELQSSLEQQKLDEEVRLREKRKRLEERVRHDDELGLDLDPDIMFMSSPEPDTIGFGIQNGWTRPQKNEVKLMTTVRTDQERSTREAQDGRSKSEARRQDVAHPIASHSTGRQDAVSTGNGNSYDRVASQSTTKSTEDTPEAGRYLDSDNDSPTVSPETSPEYSGSRRQHLRRRTVPKRTTTATSTEYNSNAGPTRRSQRRQR